MKKTLKRIGALALALCLVLALSVSAMAADTDLTMTGGVAGAFNTTDKDASLTVDTDKSISIAKELTAYNPDASDVKAPVITYTYTITAGDANKSIIDDPAVHTSAASSHVLTKAGLIPGLAVTGATNGTAKTTATTAASGATSVADTIVWNNEGTLKTAADGNANMSNLKLDFSSVAFAAAGVYRYVITEVAAAYGTNGVVDGNADNSTTQVRYLDVYVKDGATSDSFDIYGYVCFKNSNDIEYPTSGSVAAAEKTNGFVDTDTTATDASNADKYYTFDVEIKKVLNNDQAMNNNQFPFKVTFANTTVTSNVLLIASGTEGKTTVPTMTSQAISSYAFDGTSSTAAEQIKIANGATVKFVGIPAGTTVTIDEYNNVVGTTYKVSTANGTTNTTAAVAVEWNKWASAVTGWTTVTALGGTANTNAKVAANFAGTGKEVTFTNVLELISPTGVVLRFAPYMFILAAGIVLLILSVRRRRMADEA